MPEEPACRSLPSRKSLLGVFRALSLTLAIASARSSVEVESLWLLRLDSAVHLPSRGWIAVSSKASSHGTCLGKRSSGGRGRLGCLVGAEDQLSTDQLTQVPRGVAVGVRDRRQVGCQRGKR